MNPVQRTKTSVIQNKIIKILNNCIFVYNGRKFEIGANDFQFISSKLNDMNEDEDGYCVEFSILKESDVVDAWNAEVRARGLSDIITQDDLRRKVKDCYW